MNRDKRVLAIVPFQDEHPLLGGAAWRLAKDLVVMLSHLILLRVKQSRVVSILTLIVVLGSIPYRSRAMDEPLSLPAVGETALKMIAPDLLELTLITTKAPPPARPTQWNFIAANLQYILPGAVKFAVSADGAPIVVQSVGFRRVPVYAPFKVRDLRIGNFLYLKLASPLQEGQSVQVLNPDGTLWPADTHFTATLDPMRFSPAIHVNQQGYLPLLSKKAIVGYFLGTFGELNVPASAGFQIVQSATGQVLYSGSLTSRGDRGYSFSPAPYQRVYEADFSAFTTPGQYQLLVPGLGTSYSFRIDDAVAGAFARTYALGLYHQRCGTNNTLPYTRDTHDLCHVRPATVPTMSSTAVNKELADFSADYKTTAPRQTARQLKDVASSLYPFVNTSPLDVAGGHHDAGDYSKYTTDSAQLLHALIFAVDNFAGVAALDNLGLPESGDGISDVMQEAKWEADFLAKMQDADGGFYFLVYPRDRAYEDNVLPDHGDPQVVFPKNTAATAAAAAALTQAATSPLFKKTYPDAAAAYLAQAQKAWTFLQNAFNKYTRDGAYQKISHYGNEFIHDDEVAWLATELFLATGDHSYENEVISRFDPSNPSTLRDGWVRMWEGYGCAVRSYAFASSSGRIGADQLNSDYLAKCRAQIFAAADDQARFSDENAYGSSFPDPDKGGRVAGWYFSVDQAFDLAVAAQLDERPKYLETILRNLNYEAGCNPVNVSFITGLGSKRQRDIVHQYAQNDRRVLPPSGFPLGNLQQGFPLDLTLYPNELPGLVFPSAAAASAPYAPYDIWGDTYNLTTEFVNPQQAHSLAITAYLMGKTSLKDQPWTPLHAEIQFASTEVMVGTNAAALLSAPGIDLSEAQIIWEGRNQQPFVGTIFQLVPSFLGPYWVEVEAQLPDGRRIFAASEFQSVAGHRIAVLGPSQLSISGAAGQTFTLQASSDLIAWENLVTDTFTSDSYEFTDETTSGLRCRFYRAIAAP